MLKFLLPISAIAISITAISTAHKQHVTSFQRLDQTRYKELQQLQVIADANCQLHKTECDQAVELRQQVEREAHKLQEQVQKLDR